MRCCWPNDEPRSGIDEGDIVRARLDRRYGAS